MAKKPKKTEEEEKPEAPDEDAQAPIDIRLKDLEDMGLSKNDIVLRLYDEGYSTHDIMKRHLPLKALKRKRERVEASVIGSMEGGVKGPGYLEELKNMVRGQIGRTRELTEEFYNLGMGVLLASLQ